MSHGYDSAVRIYGNSVLSDFLVKITAIRVSGVEELPHIYTNRLYSRLNE